MLTVTEALTRVLQRTCPLSAESVPVVEAWDRVLAEDVRATRDVPGWNASAMDGYAVRAADTREAEATLLLTEVIAAGATPARAITPGTAAAIMTGAPVPEGADAVVMVEDTDASREGSVVIRGLAHAGQHIRPRGEDLSEGDLLLRAGQRLGAAALGLAASQGITRLLVSRRPVVAILSTGDEVVAPGQPIGPGQLYSSNNASLAGLVREAGGLPLDAGNVPDALDAIVTRLQWCVDQTDVVVTTGGVSVGAFDWVKEAFSTLGIAMDFWKVAMKPGKPLAFGVVEQRGRVVPVFGLPGNPVSCMVNFLEFVRPWLLVAAGADDPYLPVITCRAAADVKLHPGRAQLLRVRVEQGDDGFVCHLTGNQSSGVLTSMVRADGLALIPADCAGLKAGDPVRVQLFDRRVLDRADPGYPF